MNRITMSIIEIKNLTRTYDSNDSKVIAVDNVSLTFYVHRFKKTSFITNN